MLFYLCPDTEIHCQGNHITMHRWYKRGQNDPYCLFSHWCSYGTLEGRRGHRLYYQCRNQDNSAEFYDSVLLFIMRTVICTYRNRIRYSSDYGCHLYDDRKFYGNQSGDKRRSNSFRFIFR